MTRIRALATTLLLAATLTSCASPAPSVSSTPTHSATPTASPSAVVDYTRPGAAREVLTQLLEASGQKDLIKVELTRTSAQIAVVDGSAAKSWAWRGGKAEQVDGDTQYLGQARFTLDQFSIDDVGALFTQARAVSGSAAEQQLQIVDYSGGQVYMTVTTSPETQTVFFRPDGSLVPTLDLTTTAGLSSGLRDAIGSAPALYAVTISPANGVAADMPGSEPGFVRRVRATRYPARVELRTDKPVSALTFPPTDVSADVLAQLTARYRGPQNSPVSFAIDRRDGLSDPTIRVTVDGRTVICDLAGNDITAVVKH